MRCEVEARIDHELGQSQPHSLEIRLANRRLRGDLVRGFRNRVAPVLLDLGDVGGGAGGECYWAAWAPVPMRFAKRDLARVPEHWRTFGIRASPITGTSRSAGNPINALLNYTYAILETEVRLTILAMGPDPGMGMLHADLKNRDSLVYDLLEPLRPIVDGYVLTLLEERSFAAKKFFETRQGDCRLMPPLPQRLAELSPRLAKLAAPVVEQVAQRLAHGRGRFARRATWWPPFHF